MAPLRCKAQLLCIGIDCAAPVPPVAKLCSLTSCGDKKKLFSKSMGVKLLDTITAETKAYLTRAAF